MDAFKKVDTDGEKILCAFCSAPFTKEMIEVYNGTYACDTGCEYMTVEVTCVSCGKVIYRKGEFGSCDSDDERKEITEEAWADILKEAKPPIIITDFKSGAAPHQ